MTALEVVAWKEIVLAKREEAANKKCVHKFIAKLNAAGSYPALKTYLFNKTNLNDAKLEEFCCDFLECANVTLGTLNSNTDLIAYWRENKYHILNLSKEYTARNHQKNWDFVKDNFERDGEPLSTLVSANYLSHVDIFNPSEPSPFLTYNDQFDNRVIAGCGIHPDKPGKIYSYYNFRNNYNVDLFFPTLPKFLRDRARYLNLINDDLFHKGSVYKNLYQSGNGFLKGKLNSAGRAGIHAEVRIIAAIAADIGIQHDENAATAYNKLSSCRLVIRGSNFGHMFRCPHCFFLTDGRDIMPNEPK